MTFGARLYAAIEERGPFCVGIDPHSGLLHEWGLDDDVAGLERFALGVVEAVAPHCSVVKPQSAFYERFGSRGVAVLEQVIAQSRAAGALVLLDVKRGDIGSTSQAYADAYLDQSSPLAADAITASPYLGFGSIAPMIETARKHEAGVFVLAETSNKEGPEVQHARLDDGRTVAARMIDHLPRAQRRRAAARLVRGRGRRDNRRQRDRLLVQRADPRSWLRRPGRHLRRRRPHLRGGRRQRHSELLARGAAAGSGPGRDAGRRTPCQRRAASRMRRRLVGFLAVTLLGVSLAGCAEDDPFATYCDEVREQQKPLTEALAIEGPTALIEALPSFEALSDKAPDDITDDWLTLVRGIDGLVQALEDAGVDPASYDRDQPPDGVTEEQQTTIDTAARRLTAPDTVLALEAVQQQARDVCKTPLSL